MSETDPWIVVRQAQAGDPAAQEKLIRQYQERVAGFVFSMVGQADAVEDLTQTVFIRMILGLRRLRDPARFPSWLFRLARNACFDHLRRQKWQRIFTVWLPEHDAIPHDPPSATADSIEWLRAALQRLPAAQREVVTLVGEGGLSYGDIARMTGRSISSVKSLLFRARETLKAGRKHEGS